MKAVFYNIKIILVGILVVITLYFWLQWRDARGSHIQLQELLADTVHHFEVMVTIQGQEIAIQDQKVANLENAIAAGIIKNEDLQNKNLKQVDHIIKLENQIVFYEELVAAVDTPSVVTIDNTSPTLEEGTYLKVPANFT